MLGVDRTTLPHRQVTTVAERTVLIIEDDPRIVRYLTMYCEADGWRVRSAADGWQGWQLFLHTAPDFVLLDLMLPGLDGFELCRRLRARSAVPVIVITARNAEVDRLLGLEIGADDYVVKPFSPREVVARMRAVMRRITGAPPGTAHAPAVPAPITVGALRIDPATREVCYGDMTVAALTAKEFALLHTLAGYPGKVYTRLELEEALYDTDALVGSRAIAAHMSNLRTKLEHVGAANVIETLHGIGYRLRKE